jgi:hypothetical protein
MKNVFSTIILLGILLLTGCRNEEPDIFGASPAERMNKSINYNYDLLTGVSGGWVMEYFANSESPGYNLLVKFNKSGSAIMASKSELTKNTDYEQDSCLFEIIGDNGPVLTFNTYNNLLHRFSNPIEPPGYGLKGDYEFVIMKSENERMILRGKKYAATIVLTKLAETTSWKTYLQDIENLNSTLFANKAPKLTLTIGKSVYKFSNGLSHIFNVVKEGPTVNTIDIPFIVNSQGIRFHAEQEFDGLKFQTFKLNADKSALVSVENPDYKLSGPADLGTYFTGNVITWEIINNESSTDIASIYNTILQSCYEKYKAQDVQIAIKYSTIRKTFVLTLAFTESGVKKEGNLDLTITLNGKNALTIVNKGTGDTNGLLYKSDITGFSQLATAVSSGFLLTNNALINPQKIKLTKTSDSNTWFTIQAK